MSTKQSNSNPPERSRETRVGLVMHGGVSLAVYINGVSQEFYHAVQGNGVYHLIKELTDSEISLDIVSGSSAGGINGILLSYALSNDKDFTRCADLWRNSADIRRLLRSTAATEEPVKSVLDSEGYYQTELENAFRLLDGSPAYAESPSPLKELDLFVTGTDVDGRTYKRVDDAGHVLDVKDHRAVFHLKYREGRKSNFDSSRNPAVVMALSKLARITSCFPGAFAPVFVSHSEVQGKPEDRMSVNELLQYWGALPAASYLIDGGVIDNKPFTHTVREIFFRTAERKVDRKLFYVEPDPERFPARAAGHIPGAPSFLKPIVNSLVTIPGYESIADDLKFLSSRNENVREYNHLLEQVSRACDPQEIERCGAGVPTLNEPQRSIYTRARYASISERVLEGVFKNANFENLPVLAQQRSKLIEAFDQMVAGSSQTLEDFDILFRLRRIFHLIYDVYDRLYQPREEGPVSEHCRTRYLQLLRRLNTQMELLNVLHSSMEKLVDEVDYGWNDTDDTAIEVWKRAGASLHQLLHAEGLRERLRNLGDLNAALARRIEQSKVSVFDVPNFRSVLADTDALEVELLHELLEGNDPVLRRYYHFNAIDAHLFPIEWVSGLREKDVVEVCRISPVDAQQGFSRRDAHQKTAGDTLAHFSAFFKRTWRSNDITWGRLDGACQLIESLMTPKSLLEAMANDDSRRRAREKLLPSDGSTSPFDGWFRDSSEAAIERIKTWVREITNEDAETRRLAAKAFVPDDAAQTNSVRELLIEMAQYRILHEALPQVLEDSIKEQVEWKQLRRPLKNDPEKMEWLGVDVGVGGAALDAMASIGGLRLLDELESGRPTEESPKNSRLGRAFHSFQIGSENLASGVPPIVLAEIASRAMLVLRNCLLGSFDKRKADKVRASTFYRWGIDFPLRAFHGAVIFFKSAPAFQTSALVGITIASLLALLIGLKWEGAIIHPHGQLDFTWLAVFFVFPLTWLSAGLYQLSRSRIRRAHFADSARHALIFLCTAAPLISATLVYFGLTDLLWDWWNGTAEPVDSKKLQLLMVVLYGIVPFLLSFIGGYLAVRESTREPEIEDYAAVMERVTDAELQDVSDRMGESHRVTPDNRTEIVQALVASAEMRGGAARLCRAIRASCPGELD